MSERTIFQAMSNRHVISLGPEATVYEAACVMTAANFGSVLVIGGQTELLGILTERDLMTRVIAKAIDPMTAPISSVMTPHPRCAPPEMRVADAVLIMIERGFRNLPVVGEDGKIYGVFSARDALPREVTTAVDLAAFHDSVNDSLV